MGSEGHRALDLSKCNHLWKPYADAKRIWTVCEKCGEEQHCTTHAEQMRRSLAYIFRDFEVAE